MAKRYRYILCGLVGQDEPVSSFRLIASNSLGTADQAVRIDAGSLDITRYGQDGYSTTDDPRPVRAFSPMPVVKINGRWREMPELSGIQPHAWYLELRKAGLHGTVDRGYLAGSKYAEHAKSLKEKAKASLPANTEDILGMTKRILERTDSPDVRHALMRLAARPENATQTLLSWKSDPDMAAFMMANQDLFDELARIIE